MSDHPLLKFFQWEHLPTHLQRFSQPFQQLALAMDSALPDGSQKDAGMQKLLEAKDCFVRARL